jgi:hypothetical protein
MSVDPLLASSPKLLSRRDPVETLMRFRVLRATFFDFEALTVPTLVDDHAEVVIAYGMGVMAEEAASYQTMGFFERLLELASATHIEARFKSRDWTHLATGSPVLIDALVSFDCRVVKKLAHGTHTIFLGHVEQVLIGKKGKPLLYSDGQYAKLASLTLGEPLPEGLDYWGF